MKKITIIFLLIIILIIPTYFVNANENKVNMNGYIIYVDAGHGGKDNGAFNNTIVEDAINLSISKLLVKELVNSGAFVYTSRDGDYDLASSYDRNRKAKDLKKRVELINNIKPHLFVSIHLNTDPSENVSGGQIFFQNNEKSKKLANVLQDKFNGLSNKSKKAKLGDYYLLNKTESVGVIIECGFITNHSDLEKLVKEEYQNKMALTITQGIYEYFKL